MRLPFQTPLLTGLLISLAFLRAQTPQDPAGHWEGTVQLAGMERSFEVDLAKNQGGELTGTITMREQNLKGLPLQKIAVDGRSVRFQARSDQPFTGLLSPDGISITGDVSFSGFAIPFEMTRTGEPRLEVPAKLAPIAKELEGKWEGVMEDSGGRLGLVLAMANQPDGTANAMVINLDEGGLEIPVSSITRTASSVALEFAAVGGSFSGALNHESTELTGTYQQGALAAPLRFRRAAPDRQQR
jgi:hypothetical protein